MRRTIEASKTVTVVGLGKTGVGLCALLSTIGKKVRLSEQSTREQAEPHYRKVARFIRDAQFGGHTLDFIKDSELIVVNPSVPLRAEIFRWAADRGIPAIGEIELCYHLCPGTIVAVTGSIGKTTTTSLIFKILKKHSGKKTHLLGNIGIPFSEYVLSVKKGDLVCLEVSSYQLGTIRDFRPHIGILLNIVPNHLDVHASFDEYRRCKLNVFKNQTPDDFCLLNAMDRAAYPELASALGQKVYFSKNGYRNENFAAVVSAVQILGVSAQDAHNVISSFKGLPHRLEHVAAVAGVDYLNDSKSTTVDSTIWALGQLPQRVILICGGRDKGLSYERLLPALQNVKEVVIIGEAQQKIFNALAAADVPKKRLGTMAEAVAYAASRACPGEAVLLSCMCSSFDMFKNYKERGNVFKKLVRALGA